MYILRAAVVGLLCVCYVSCQVHPVDVMEDKSGTQTISNKGEDSTHGYCGNEVQKYEPPKLCGISNPGECAMKYNGKHEEHFAGFGDYPWMVALLKTGETEWVNKDYIGGGSIIHPSVVLTAAHKVEKLKPEAIKCRAGEWDTRSKKELLPYQDRYVKKIVIHGEFNTSNVHNDVALLFLSEPFVLAPHVGIACLGTVLPQPGTECYSMGWGGDINQNIAHFTTLKKIPLKLVESKKCENIYKEVLENSTYSLHDSLICAGSEGEFDTCVGDGGSPLVCSVPEQSGESRRYAIYGVVAYGVGCGEKDIPGVYVNVPQMYQWVKDQMVTEKISDSNFDI